MGPRPGFSPQEENAGGFPLRGFEPGLRDPQSLVLTATLPRPPISMTFLEIGSPFSRSGFKRITLSSSRTSLTEPERSSLCLASAGRTSLFFLSSFTSRVKAIHSENLQEELGPLPLYKTRCFPDFFGLTFPLAFLSSLLLEGGC